MILKSVYEQVFILSLIVPSQFIDLQAATVLDSGDELSVKISSKVSYLRKTARCVTACTQTIAEIKSLIRGGKLLLMVLFSAQYFHMITLKIPKLMVICFFFNL